MEREPITADERAKLGELPLGEDEAEVTVARDRPVLAKETVPVERVRATKQTVTDQATVSEELAREQIEVDHQRR